MDTLSCSHLLYLLLRVVVSILSSGIEPAGLFWSMVPVKEARKGVRLMKKDVTTPFAINVYVLHGHQLVNSKGSLEGAMCQEVIYRWYMGPGVQRYPVKAGRLRGTLFVPPGWCQLHKAKSQIKAPHTLTLSWCLLDPMSCFKQTLMTVGQIIM